VVSPRLFLCLTFGQIIEMTLLLFGFGGGEIIIILLFVLLFFGSKSIPDVARNLGRGMRQFRDATNDIQRDITDSVKDVKRTIENDEEK